MYTIYADGELLYAPHLSDAGCGLFSPQLTLELNQISYLDFVLPPDNGCYAKLQKLATRIVVYNNDEVLFRGRILNDDKDFYNQKTTHCEGELGFLLDSRIRPYVFNGTAVDYLRFLLEKHNQSVDAEKRFTVGAVTAEHAKTKVKYKSSNFPSAFDEINTNIIEALGGYLSLREENGKRLIDWSQESGKQNSQTVEFGVNLLDLAEYISGENLFTVLIPIGEKQAVADENAVDSFVSITSVNNGKDYLEDSKAVALFGRIEETYEWSEVTNPTELKRLGEEYLAQNANLAITLTVKAVDLSQIYADYESIKLGDWVRVISVPHGVDRWFQCTKIVIDLIEPDKTEYTFGYDQMTMTELQAKVDTQIQNSVISLSKTIDGKYVTKGSYNSTMTNLEARVAALENPST